MIVNDLNNIRNLNLSTLFFKHQALGVNKIYRILAFPVSLKRVAASDFKSYHFFNSSSSTYLIDAKLYFFGHLIAIFFLCY